MMYEEYIENKESNKKRIIEYMEAGVTFLDIDTVFIDDGVEIGEVHYSDKETLVSSQMFMEGVQFDLTYIDMEHLAYKVAMIAMSNIDRKSVV